MAAIVISIASGLVAAGSSGPADAQEVRIAKIQCSGAAAGSVLSDEAVCTMLGAELEKAFPGLRAVAGGTITPAETGAGGMTAYLEISGPHGPRIDGSIRVVNGGVEKTGVPVSNFTVDKAPDASSHLQLIRELIRQNFELFQQGE